MKIAKLQIVAALLGLLLAGCSRHSEGMNQRPGNSGASSNWTGNTSAEIKSNFSNFIPVMSNLMNSNYGQAMANSSVKAGGVFESNVLFILTNSAPTVNSAEEFLTGLKMRGDLPGVPRDSHGSLTINVGADTAVVRYPCSLTFNLVLVGDTLTNHFLVTRSSADAIWQLRRVWRTDLGGTVVKEWPVSQP